MYYMDIGQYFIFLKGWHGIIRGLVLVKMCRCVELVSLKG